MNYNQEFASDSDYILFAHTFLQKLQLNSQINLETKKVACSTLTTGILSKTFKETVYQFIARYKTYSFMIATEGAPAYWDKFLHKVLEIPTFFLTLLCADLQ